MKLAVVGATGPQDAPIPMLLPSPPREPAPQPAPVDSSLEDRIVGRLERIIDDRYLRMERRLMSRLTAISV